MLYEPVKRLTGIHNIFQQALGASQKVFEYLDRDQQIVEKPNAAKLGKFQQAIVFDNVDFHYPNAPNGFRSERRSPGSARRRSGGAGGPERRGKNHARQSGAALLRRHRRRGPDRRQRRARSAARFAAQPDRHRGAGDVSVQRHGGQQYRLRPAQGQATKRFAKPRAMRWPKSSSSGCPKATTPSSASAASS